ncbi:MAG TPA: hypothetical protein VL915_04070, partial [Gemmatimonadales bacterium]|nr:hypothetical protein [Gemmatimonadales bacterium]
MTSTDKTVTATTQTMETAPAPAGPPSPADSPTPQRPELAMRGGGSRERGPSLRLATRFLLLAAGLIVVPLAVAIGVTAWRAEQVASQAVSDALEAAQVTRVQFDRLRARQLELIVKMVGSDPAFVAYVAEGHAPSTADLLSERRQGLGCDFAIVLDRAAKLLAHT